MAVQIPTARDFLTGVARLLTEDGEPIPTDEINATLEQISELVNSLLDRTGIGDVTLSVPRATSERELFTDDLMATAIGLAFTQNLIERTRFRRMTQ